ncbi:MAG: hypothetical protein QOH06_3652 [Acidobacteriota bacterium]|jgi:hypothetical protein|nr:hypothetical protein [Acidobacteriota bacterium]
MNTRDIENIYPLSPIQQGMLFHCLYSPEPGLYSAQLSCTLRGEIVPGLVARAGQALVNRHPVFRTAFLWEGLKEPMQVVLRHVELPVVLLDWSRLSPDERELRTEAFLQADRSRGFNFSRPPLLRLALCSLAVGELRLIWSFHHLVMDGWSESLVLGEFEEICRALSCGEAPRLPQIRPYGEYIAWLQHQDVSRVEEFWQLELSGFNAPTPFGPGGPDTPDPLGSERRVKSLKAGLPEPVMAALQALAGRYRLTLNTLVQGAWALLLGHLSGESDVVFGSTISSRPSALEDIEFMVGPFINTLPVRVRLLPEMDLLAWLALLQDRQVEVRQYAYTPLGEIQRWSEVPRNQPLFKSIVVFQNGPAALFPEGSVAGGGGLAVHDLDFRGGATNYPLTFEVDPGASLGMTINFDCRRISAGVAARMVRILEAIFGRFATAGAVTLGEILAHLERIEQQREIGIQEDLELAALRKLKQLRRRRPVAGEEEAAS